MGKKEIRGNRKQLAGPAQLDGGLDGKEQHTLKDRTIN